MNREELIKYVTEYYQECIDKIVKKNSDYALTDDAFSNFRLVESYKVASTEQGIFTRLSDKFARVATYIRTGKYEVEEDLEETCQDACNYFAILCGYEKHERGQKENLSVCEFAASGGLCHLLELKHNCLLDKDKKYKRCFLRRRGLEERNRNIQKDNWVQTCDVCGKKTWEGIGSPRTFYGKTVSVFVCKECVPKTDSCKIDNMLLRKYAEVRDKK